MNSTKGRHLQMCCLPNSGTSISNPEDIEKAIFSYVANDHRDIDRVRAILGVDIQQEIRKIQPYLTTEEVRQLDAEGSLLSAPIPLAMRGFANSRLKRLRITSRKLKEKRLQRINQKFLLRFPLPRKDYLGNFCRNSPTPPEVGLMFGADGIAQMFSMRSIALWRFTPLYKAVKI